MQNYRPGNTLRTNLRTYVRTEEQTITPALRSMHVSYLGAPLLLPCPLRLVQRLLVSWHSLEELSTTKLLGHQPTDSPTPHHSQSPHNTENPIYDIENKNWLDRPRARHRMRQENNATEECKLYDATRTYEAHTLLDFKRYLALYGVARQSTCTDLCGGHRSRRGAPK